MKCVDLSLSDYNFNNALTSAELKRTVIAESARGYWHGTTHNESFTWTTHMGFTTTHSESSTEDYEYRLSYEMASNIEFEVGGIEE